MDVKSSDSGIVQQEKKINLPLNKYYFLRKKAIIMLLSKMKKLELAFNCNIKIEIVDNEINTYIFVLYRNTAIKILP